MSKSAEAFRTISEVAGELDVPKHVLRFWEAKFPQIRPMKRGGGRRYYRPGDMELLRGIRHLLHAEGYTIKGVQKILREQGVDAVKCALRSEAVALPVEARARKPAAGAAPGRSSGLSEPGPEPTMQELMRQMIAELEACRSLLGAGAAAAALRSGRRARTGRG